MITPTEMYPTPVSPAAVVRAEPDVASVESNDYAALEADYYFAMYECVLADSLRHLFNLNVPEQSCHTRPDCAASEDERRRIAALLYAHGKCVECFDYSWEDVKLVCFRFLVAGELFSWHYPAEYVPFQYVTNAWCSAFRLKESDKQLADLAVANFHQAKPLGAACA